jgi:hypothetical protein
MMRKTRNILVTADAFEKVRILRYRPVVRLLVVFSLFLFIVNAFVTVYWVKTVYTF